MTTTLALQIHFFMAFLIYLGFYVYLTWFEFPRYWDRSAELLDTFLWALAWEVPFTFLVGSMLIRCFYIRTGLQGFLEKERRWRIK
jgi:hypothetical protein